MSPQPMSSIKKKNTFGLLVLVLVLVAPPAPVAVAVEANDGAEPDVGSKKGTLLLETLDTWTCVTISRKLAWYGLGVGERRAVAVWKCRCMIYA